jgi:hypothetical protein
VGGFLLGAASGTFRRCVDQKPIGSGAVAMRYEPKR